MANKPCGSSVVGGEGARGMLLSEAVAWLTQRQAVVTMASTFGAVGSCTVARSARGDDRAAAVGR